MGKPATCYMVLRRSNIGVHYILATRRRFWRYSDAALFLQSLDLTSDPIILMIG